MESPFNGSTLKSAWSTTNKLVGHFTDEDAEILATLAAHLTDILANSPVAAALKAQNTGQAAEPTVPYGTVITTRNIVGISHRIQSIIRLIDQIRSSSVDVLIHGESGTGKELIAKALHHNSPRAKQPFVALNCAALPESLIESELFGIEKGVANGVDRRIGKFEAAHGGTRWLFAQQPNLDAGFRRHDGRSNCTQPIAGTLAEPNNFSRRQRSL